MSRFIGTLKHMANEDPEDFIAWIGEITGYTTVFC